MLAAGGSMRLVCAGLVCVALVAEAAPKKANPKREAEEQQARGDAWTVAGRCDEAVKSYREALKLDAKNGVAKVRLPHCLAKTNVADRARKVLEERAPGRPPGGPMARGGEGG